jgi:hypothetical protein
MLVQTVMSHVNRSTHERTEEQGRPVSWLIRIWLTPLTAVAGRVVEVTARSLWVRLPWLPNGFMNTDGQFAVDIHSETGHQQRVNARVVHIGAGGVTLRTDEDLLGFAP